MHDKMQALKMIKGYNNNIIISAAACCTKRITGNEMDGNRIWVSGCTASPRNGFPPTGKGMPLGCFGR